MKEYLIFRLYGPIVSWGEIAVGENRNSFSYPSKSAVIGLISAAMGFRREEEDKHLMLTNSLSFGVKVFSSGILLRDYHTIQTPGKSKFTHSTRKDELRDKFELNTILSSRDYRMDSLYDVCIWKKKDSIDLENIQKNLNQPVFSLFLGRKSAVMASPLFPNLIKEKNLFLAFQDYEKKLKENFHNQNVEYFFENKKLNSKSIEYIWEDEESQFSEIRTRRDEVLSRKRWQFSERKEFYKMEKK